MGFLGHPPEGGSRRRFFLWRFLDGASWGVHAHDTLSLDRDSRAWLFSRANTYVIARVV